MNDPRTGLLIDKTNTLIQIATGLNYQDASGAWQESQDLIAMTADGGAAALDGPLQVRFSAAGLSDEQALTITTPMQQVLWARVQGVYLADNQSGQSRLLAMPSDSAVPELLSPNQIIYRSAFNSDLFQADLRYTYTRAGLESDVIITRQPNVSPQDCGFNPDTTLLQVWHEWRNAPAPVSLRPITVGSGAAAIPDQFVDLGEMLLPPGTAWTIDSASIEDTNVPAKLSTEIPWGSEPRIPVGKEWQSGAGPGGSDLLIESVTWAGIATNLAQLPLMAMADGLPWANYFADTAACGGTPPGDDSRNAGFLLDYTLLSVSSSNADYTFQSYSWPGGPTYLVYPNSAYFTGTVTFQPNCVIKFSLGTGLTLYGSVVCSGDQNNPSVLTSYFDNQYGDALEPTPPYYNPGPGTYGIGTALYFDYAIQGNLALDGLVIRYATTAIECDESCSCGGGPCLGVTVANCAFYECTTGLYVNGMNATIQNSAVGSVTTPFNWAGGCLYAFNGSFGAGTAPASVTLSPEGQIIQSQGTAIFTATISPATTAPTYQWMAKGGSFGSAQQIANGSAPALLLGNPGDLALVQVIAGNPFGTAPASSWWEVVELGPGSWADWQYLLGRTNGTTPNLWANLPNANPPNGMGRNNNSVIYQMNGYTAISQLNSWGVTPNGYTPGVVPVTALTGLHGYTRGHGIAPAGTIITNYYSEQNPIMTVWFCDANNNLVTANVLALISHGYLSGAWDHTVLLFDKDVSALGISPMQVGNPPTGDNSEFIALASTHEWFGGLPCTLQEFHYLLDPYFGDSFDWSPQLPLFSPGWGDGDSGSPVMMLTTDGTLVFIMGITTDAPAEAGNPIQGEMDYLISWANTNAGWNNVNPANYQMQYHSTP